MKDEIASSSRRLFIRPLGKPSMVNSKAYLKSELKVMLPPNVRFENRKKNLQIENKGY